MFGRWSSRAVRLDDERSKVEPAHKMEPLVTGVLTSCGRHDLLVDTLQSFFATNAAPIDRMIVVEDGPEVPQSVRSKLEGQPIEWISTGVRVGQIAAIDYAYSRVATPYVFHLEDDWNFYRSGYIEKSLDILQENPKCIQVQIRALSDLMGHPLEPHIYRSGQAEWRRLAPDYFGEEGDWHGFCFNPGLRRLSDYISVGGYGVHTKFDMKIPWLSESALSKLYRLRDFYAAVLSDDNGSGYVRHTGDDRHVEAPRDSNS
ncbi:MAG: glycosyltransferase [Planctomycetaceae bacterium]|nr:glycosyltransferase [Planctomycetaceae bacterium]